MPSKIRPDDWDRLFAPNAPRRGGPLRALAITLVTLLLIGLIGGGTTYVLNARSKLRSAQIATATAFAATVGPQQTITAVAAATATAARIESRTATAVAKLTPQVPQTTPEPSLGLGVVTRGGNLRSEPRVADETVLGLIWSGDQVTFLEQRDVGGQPWFRIRVVQAAADRGGPGVNPGVEGWASAALLSQPTPQPAP